MTKRRNLTTSEKHAAEKLKALYLNLKERMKAEGKTLTYDTIADFIDKTPGAVSQFMNGNTPMNREMVLRMARFFNVDPVQIYPEVSDLLPNVTDSDRNVSQLPNNHNEVPLISWVQAGVWQDVIEPRTASDAEKWILCPEPHSSQTFALRVHGLSMRNPGQSPSFDEGDIIHVDPEIPAENGSLVVVQINGDTEATFKQLIIEGGQYFLKALNPSWPNQIREMPKDARICGVVISKTVSYR